MENGEYRLVVRDDPKSPAAEAIRTLRTNLQFIALDRPLKTILVTSAGPAEGKTSIAGNLAVSVAQTGKRVAVIGADLRKPGIHHLFRLGNTVGLTNVLLGQATLAEALQETGVEGVKLLSAGPTPPNPSELVGSQAMRGLLHELSEGFDLVVVDSPPVVAVSDSVIMSRFIDGTLLVVAMNQTPRELVKQAKEQLAQVNARLLGAVANKFKIKSQSYYYYYYSPTGEVAATNGRASGVMRRGFLGRMIRR